MQRDNFKKETNLLQHIAQASNAIRRKHKLIKSGRETTEKALSEVLKPVVTPLEKLVNQSVMKEMKPEMKVEKEELLNESENVKNEYDTAFDSFSPERLELQQTPMTKMSIPKTSTPIYVSTKSSPYVFEPIHGR